MSYVLDTEDFLFRMRSRRKALHRKISCHEHEMFQTFVEIRVARFHKSLSFTWYCFFVITILYV
ncbi:hypothetical protein MTR_5g033280 [Medicago truncatula]|uniref:Uncharacterized protein n=1 Tax=Medicago truncatula TaxID=3880 RepID=G7JYZ3_MEDTR|nr:hypothetical protein MTR_5g033280 [Medicago truncatula]